MLVGKRLHCSSLIPGNHSRIETAYCCDYLLTLSLQRLIESADEEPNIFSRSIGFINLQFIPLLKFHALWRKDCRWGNQNVEQLVQSLLPLIFLALNYPDWGNVCALLCTGHAHWLVILQVGCGVTVSRILSGSTKRTLTSRNQASSLHLMAVGGHSVGLIAIMTDFMQHVALLWQSWHGCMLNRYCLLLRSFLASVFLRTAEHANSFWA